MRRIALARLLLVLLLRRWCFVHPLPGAPRSRLACAASRHRLGDIVEVRCEEDGLWYQAIVEHENQDGSYTVRFDKEGYEYHLPLTAWRVPKTRHFIDELEEGEMLSGRVTDISSMGFYVDVGAEDEGFVHISELQEGTKIGEVRIGQDVSVRVLSASGGELSLSMKLAGETTGLAAFKDLPSDMLLRATITETAAFGAFANVVPPQGGEPCRGLIHISAMGRGFVQAVEDEVVVGQEVLVSVIATENDRLSLRLETEKESIDVVEGVWMEGSVSKVLNYGAFVSVRVKDQNVTGLLHVSEMEDDFVVNASEQLKEGDNVTVRLLMQKKSRVNWTCRRLQQYSAEDLKAFQPLMRKKEFVKGLVQQTRPGGAYVLLQPPDGGIAVQGMLRRADVDLADFEELEDRIVVGQELEVCVLSTENGRLMLSTIPPIPSAFYGIQQDLWLRGVVKELVDFGAFVEVQAPFEKAVYQGLVHIGEIKDSFVERVEDELKVNQEVSVRIKSIEGKRMSLSMRPPEKPKKSKAERLKVEKAPVPFQNVSGWLDAEVEEMHPYGATVKVVDPNTGEAHLGTVHRGELAAGFVGPWDLERKMLSLRHLDGLRFSARPEYPTLDVPEEMNGTVAQVTESYALVNVSLPGSSVEGYLHASETSELSTEGLREGQQVQVQKLWSLGDRLALSTRETMGQRTDFELKQKVQGVVNEVTPVGVAVRLQPVGGGRVCRGLIPMPWLDVDVQLAEGDAVKLEVAELGRYLLLSPA